MKPAQMPIQMGEVPQALTLAEDLLAANGFYKRGNRSSRMWLLQLPHASVEDPAPVHIRAALIGLIGL